MNYQLGSLYIYIWPVVGILIIGTICVGVWEGVTNYQETETQMSRLVLIQLIQTLVFIVTAAGIFWQLNQAARRRKMDRLVAWKTSIQGISETIVQHSTLFVPLFVSRGDPGRRERLVATYACLHALETIYYMRKEEEVPPTELTRFLQAFTSGPSFRKLWGKAALRPAFTKEFQDKLTEILGP